MSSQSFIFDSRTGTPVQPGAKSQRELALELELKKLKDEPRMIATVIEVRDGHMLISVGPGQSIDVHAFKGAKVGDRVLCSRNTMQVTEVFAAGETPTGSIITVDRVNESTVEGLILGSLRAFKSPPFAVRKGERVILDPSLSYVIGTLGMPPPTHTYAASQSVSWDDIGGQEEAKSALREAIELPLSHPKLFAAYGKRVSKGVLLYGPSGTGKTLLAKAAATSIARAHGEDIAGGFIYVKGPELLNSYIGKSEEAIRALFSAAREFKAEHGYPALVFMDECDALLGARDMNRNVSLNATIVPQFLSEMDGLHDAAAMFILATNRPDMLDPAVVREGRIDRKVRVGRPTREDCEKIFAIHLRDRPLIGDGHAKAATEALYSEASVVRDLAPQGPTIRLRDFASGAMIAGVVEAASTSALLRDIETGRRKVGGISVEDLQGAIDRAIVGLGDTDLREVLRGLAEGR